MSRYKPVKFKPSDVGKELAKLPTSDPFIVSDFIAAWADIQDLRKWMMLSGWDLEQIDRDTPRATRN